jgi:hypothetical protein
MSNYKTVNTPMATGCEVYLVPNTGVATKHDVKLYQSILGSSNYALVQTRPDIAYSISILSQFLYNPSAQHIKMATRVLQYLKGTIFLLLVLGGTDGDIQLVGYIDASFAGELTGRKSHYDYVFFFI